MIKFKIFEHDIRIRLDSLKIKAFFIKKVYFGLLDLLV